MKNLPFDMVADWEPERGSDLRQLGKDLASLVSTILFLGAVVGTAAIFS